MEYWMFTLFNILFAILATLLDIYVLESSIVSTIYSLATIIPGLAVTVRRLHDVGKSGWMILVGLIPLVGFIWLLILYVTDSDAGTNEYGVSPKEEFSLKQKVEKLGKTSDNEKEEEDF